MAETAVATKQPSQKALAVKNFQAVMNNSYYQSLLQNTMKENKGAFTTSLMELFTSDPQLMQCDPNALMGEAVKAAGLRLPINKQLGQAYIVVFNNKDKETGKIIPTPTLIIGTKGYINLALRTNKYININKGTVYEGEFMGFDKVTGSLDISGEKISDVPVGYFAYFKQKSGFEKIMYMTIDEVCKFAKTYAPTVKFSKITWQELKELAIKQSVEGKGGGLGWYAGFQDMAEKTVLRQLLSSWGELSVDAEQVINADERPSAIQQRDEEFYAAAKEVIVVDAETGEVKEPAGATQAAATSSAAAPASSHRKLS